MAYNNVKVKARQTVVQSSTQTKDLGTVSEVPMGDWNADMPYKKLNLVRYNGATYIATQDNQGATPTGSGMWLLVNKDGRGITDTVITYQAGVSGMTPPTGEWVNEVPTVPQGQYLWTRVIYTFTDNTQTIAYSVSLQGLNFTQQDREDIDRITDAIPSTASEDNQLATHDFVNSSINAMAAFYITYTQGDEIQSGQAFPTHASLVNATTFYSGGKVRVPTQNDYATVLSDESQKGTDGSYPTTRYVYQGGTYPNGQWELSFIVNSTPLTQAQLDALNSGISAQKITSIDSSINNKLNKSGDTMIGLLTARGGIAFASGGGIGNYEQPMPFYLGMQAWADGGKMFYRTPEQVKADLGVFSATNLPTAVKDMSMPKYTTYMDYGADDVNWTDFTYLAAWTRSGNTVRLRGFNKNSIPLKADSGLIFGNALGVSRTLAAGSVYILKDYGFSDEQLTPDLIGSVISNGTRTVVGIVFKSITPYYFVVIKGGTLASSEYLQISYKKTAIGG